MANHFSYDVFLSYNHADKSKVLRLAERLKNAGLRVWLDIWVVKPGDIITLKMDEGLEHSRVLLLCMSAEALASNWVALERSTAIYRDPTNEGRRFIPILFTDCKLPDTMRRYRYVDYKDETDEAFSEIFLSCKHELEQISQQPQAFKKIIRKKPESAKVEETKPLAVLERNLEGHKNGIYTVAISPDAAWAASGSKDNTVKIWDLKTGKCRATLEGHTNQVNTVVITPDGTKILSSSHDNTIRIWDVATLQLLAVLEANKQFVMAIAITPDGQQAISCGDVDDTRFKIWDIINYQCIAEVEHQFTYQISLAFINNSKQFITGGNDGDIHVWELKSGKVKATLKGHKGPVRSVQITPNGRFAISGSRDRTVKIWDLEQSICIGTLEGHHSIVYAVALSPDGNLIASTGFLDDTVRLWDLKSGTCLQIIKISELMVPVAVTFSPDGAQLMVGTVLGSIYVYRLTKSQPKTFTEAPRRYVNAKVVLLGEGTVGKTSLAHRLVDDEYVIKDRTHGMNVWRLNLPMHKEDTLEKEALLWDLAGQEDYRLIHRLFLDQTSLALLLVNPQKEDPFAEAKEWLKALQTPSNDSVTQKDMVRLLVFSQIDVGGMKLSSIKINRHIEELGFAAWLPTSAKTGENCSDSNNGGQPSLLKQLIAESIPWEKLPWTSTPRLLADLKNAVMAMRDGTDIRLLRFSELAQRLEQALPEKIFTIDDIRTAVALLANHGLVRQLPFGDLVLLRPDLINGYASAVIRAARAHTDEIGCVLESDIYQLGFDFTGVERLQRPDEELLLRALVQTFLDHSLCIAEDTPEGRHLVFPSQYRREKDTPQSPDIFVSYTFSGEWQTIWTTLVVRLWYSQEFGRKELWRNAATFETSRRQAMGLLIQKESDGIAKISLYFDVGVSDELKVIFIEYVHRHLDRYAYDVTRDRHYLCLQCGKAITDLETVRQRKEAGKDFITCQQCDEKVPFIDFIEQRLKSDPVARKILAMEEVATRKLDTQALEQVLIGHMMAIAGEANQIFRPVTMFDHGIDGELEFKDNDGNASGKKIYIQLKNGSTYLRNQLNDSREVLDVSDDRHLEYWTNQPVDVYLVIRQKDEMNNEAVIRWMNITKYLKTRDDKKSKQIVFSGEKLDMEAMYRVRDEFFPAVTDKA